MPAWHVPAITKRLHLGWEHALLQLPHLPFHVASGVCRCPHCARAARALCHQGNWREDALASEYLV